jgi:hypothetical protein
MIIKQLTEVIWKYYSEGRPKATARTIRESDIQQMVMLAFGNLLRQKWYESKKLDEFGESDYSSVSPLLGTVEFELSEPNTIGMRTADMSKYDLYRLPYDKHIKAMYPICGTCGSDEISSITLVKPGEEKFYTTPEFTFFKFGVIKGRGINFYNLAAEVEGVAIETTYNMNDMDISMDIGFDIANHILGVVLKLPAFTNKIVDNSYSPPQIEMRRNLQQQ